MERNLPGEGGDEIGWSDVKEVAADLFPFLVARVLVGVGDGVSNCVSDSALDALALRLFFFFLVLLLVLFFPVEMGDTALSISRLAAVRLSVVTGVTMAFLVILLVVLDVDCNNTPRSASDSRDGDEGATDDRDVVRECFGGPGDREELCCFFFFEGMLDENV